MCMIPEQFLQFNPNLHSFLYGDYEYFAWFACRNDPDGIQDRFAAVFRWKGLHRAYNPYNVWNDWENWDENIINDYSLVTRVFLNHLREPTKYPIFDINVWTAMRELDEEIGNNTRRNYRNNDYETFYLPFFENRFQAIQGVVNCPQINGVQEEIAKRRVLDRALWEYGRLLNNGQ